VAELQVGPETELGTLPQAVPQLLQQFGTPLVGVDLDVAVGGVVEDQLVVERLLHSRQHVDLEDQQALALFAAQHKLGLLNL
jgi:hypothetical protein